MELTNIIFLKQFWDLLKPIAHISNHFNHFTLTVLSFSYVLYPLLEFSAEHMHNTWKKLNKWNLDQFPTYSYITPPPPHFTSSSSPSGIGGDWTAILEGKLLLTCILRFFFFFFFLWWCSAWRTFLCDFERRGRNGWWMCGNELLRWPTHKKKIKQWSGKTKWCITEKGVNCSDKLHRTTSIFS